VSDTVICRAANQMIKRYSDKAAMKAALRANAAMEIGDMFNSELWNRVTVSVQELERTNPPGKALN